MAQVQSFTIQKALTAGIRQDSRTPRNAEYLASALNAKCCEFGAARHEPISWPITDIAIADVASEFPCASLFRGKSKTILARKNAIYEVNEGTWAAGTAQTLYNLGAPGTQSISNGSFENETGSILDDWEVPSGALNDGVANDGWTYVDDTNSIAHTAGTAIAVAQASEDQAVALQDEHLYRVVFTVEGMTAGSITPRVGSTAGTPRTQNKMWTEDIVAETSSITAFSLVPSSDFDGTITYVSVKEVKEATIPDGTGPWQIADFEDVVFLCNGSCLVARLYLYGHWGWFVARTESGTYPLVPKTIANFNNRLLMGGISADTTYFSDDDWKDLWQTWIEHSPRDVMTYRDLTMGPNILFYSDLGGGDYYNPFIPELAMFGLLGQTEVDALKYFYTDRVKKGAMGFIPMPWQGDCLVTNRIGDYVVVYGENGVTAVLPQAEDGLAIYRTAQLANVGCAGRGAAAGDRHIHAFADRVGNIREITADQQVRLRGYKDLVGPLTDSNLCMSLDPDQYDFHITDGVTGYCMTRTGMGQTKRFPVHLEYTEEGLLAAYAPSGAEDVTFEIITDTFDLGTRELKTLQTIEVAATDVTNLTVSVGFKFDGGTTFFVTPENIASDEGFANVIASGADFQLHAKGTWGPNGKIDYITVHYTQSSKRAVGSYLTGR